MKNFTKVVLILVACLVVGLLIGLLIKGTVETKKDSVNERLTVLESKNYTIVNNYPQTIVTNTVAVDDAIIAAKVKESTLFYWNNIVFDYDCIKLYIPETDEFTMSCSKK